MNIFERASKKKLRFQTVQGNLSTEQLWDLNLEQLNVVAIALNKEVKASTEESFISTAAQANPDLTLRFDIVKSIIDTKLKAAEASKVRAEKKVKRDRLLQLAANKQIEAEGDLTMDEIQAQLDELDA